MTLPGSQAAAYSATSRAWQRGPGRIYDRLAETVVNACPVPLSGRLVLDLGAGTGAATRALRRSGATVVAVDNAVGMLLAPETSGAETGGTGSERVPGAAGDALALPFRAAVFGAVVASFCLNHLADPAAGLAEASRVTVPGGAVVASAYAEDDDHPVKAAVEAAASRAGWTPAPWYQRLKVEAMPRLATPERMVEVAASVKSLVDVRADRHEIAFPDLGPAELVAWRVGMAQLAPFFDSLAPAQRAAVSRTALDRLGPEPPPLTRRILVLTAVVA